MQRKTLWSIATLTVIGLTSSAHAIIAPYGSLKKPKGGTIAWVNGASAVPIGQNLLLTAGHVDAKPGNRVKIGRRTYFIEDVIDHPSRGVDLSLLRINRNIRTWYDIAEPVESGDRVIIGGNGALTYKKGNLFVWSGKQKQLWGENIIESTRGNKLRVRLDERILDADGDFAKHNKALEHEAIVSGGDSGGGFFVEQDGELKLAGITVFVTGPKGAARYGSDAYAIDLSAHTKFLTGAVDDLEETGYVGKVGNFVPAPGALALLAPAAFLAGPRRRRPAA